MFRFARLNRSVRRISLLVIVALALVLVALPTAAMAAPVESDYGHSQKGCGNCYVVKKGDTLSHIAKWYGINYHELARYNGISNPSSIYVGQHIRIPAMGHCGSGCGWDNNYHDGCGCSESYDSYSGYLHGYHSETTIIVDEVYYGYEYDGYDHSK